MTYDQIQVGAGLLEEFDLAVGTGPAEAAAALRTRESSRALDEAQGARTLRRRAGQERQADQAGSPEEIGSLTDRELFLLGVGLYWAEGAKGKPYRRCESVTFINSDPDMIQRLPRLARSARRRARAHALPRDASTSPPTWPRPSATGRTSPASTLSAFEQDDAQEAQPEDHPQERWRRLPRLPRHPRPQSADLYRRIEGWWYGIVVGADPAA